MAGQVTDVLGTVVSIGSTVIGPVMQACKYIESYEDNMGKLQRKVIELLSKRREIEDKMKEKEELDIEKRTAETAQWLTEVETLLDTDMILKKLASESGTSRIRRDDCCFGAFHKDPCYRFQWSRKAEKLIEDVETTIKKAPKIITEPLLASQVKAKIGEYRSRGRESRKQLMESIVTKLIDPRVRRVGLFGEHGVGKTEMVRSLIKEEKVVKAFSKIVNLNVTETPNLRNLQDKMAEDIDHGGVTLLDDAETEEQRAMKLLKHIYYRKERMLIILFNIWGIFDLKKLGISHENQDCTILVVGRTRTVMEMMEVKKNDEFEIKPLEEEEALSLFWETIYKEEKTVDNITSSEYLLVAKRMLKYCKGKTFAITALAKLARKRDNLIQWKNLEKELSLDKTSSDDDDITLKIWEKSRKLPDDSEDKQKFYMLTCVFPADTSIPIKELVKYAIGFNLLKSVSNLTQAMKQAKSWVHEMKTASLLEEDDKKGDTHVILTRYARQHAVEMREREHTDEKYMMEDIPRWSVMEQTGYNEYTTISLSRRWNHSRLEKVEFKRLEMLVLNNTQPRDHLGDDFFDGKTNLKVLVLKKLVFLPRLPTSIRKLSNLRTLLLEDCKLEDVRWLSNLENLVVLSFRRSKMEELPVMKKFKLLRLLDVSKCEIEQGIPAKVLNRLPSLEGLYAYDGFEEWEEYSTKQAFLSIFPKLLAEHSNYANIAELNDLKFLNVLELKLRNLYQLPANDEFIRTLDQFYIAIGVHDPKVKATRRKNTKRLPRTLRVGSIIQDANGRPDENHHTSTALRTLLNRTETLRVEEMSNSIYFVAEPHTQSYLPVEGESIVPEFQWLQNLEIYDCSDLVAFSSVPFRAPILADLKVANCKSLKFILLERAADIKEKFFEFRQLTLMVLEDLPNISSVSTAITNVDSQLVIGAFFNRKVLFPLLEKLILRNCGQIHTLWDTWNKSERYSNSLENLTEVNISDCQKLESLGSLSIAAALKHLKRLYIKSCSLIMKVITKEKSEYIGQIEKELGPIFPALEIVSIEICPTLMCFFSSENYESDVPDDGVIVLNSLQKIEIKDCPKMKKFSSQQNIQAPKLHSLTVDPCQHYKHEFQEINDFIDLHNSYKPLEQSPTGESSTSDVVATKNSAKSKRRRSFKSLCFGSGSVELEPSEREEGSKASSSTSSSMVQLNKLETQIPTTSVEILQPEH